MQSKATTVAKYLAELPADRRAAVEAVRKVIRKNLDKDFQEGMQYGMIGYYVPHSVYPNGYHCDPKQPLPFTALASQKNYMSLYLGCVYGSPEDAKWFKAAWAKTGKKLDMGKSCIRFTSLDDIPLEVVGEAIRRMPVKKFIAQYEATLVAAQKARRPANAKNAPASKKTARQRATARSGAYSRKSCGLWVKPGQSTTGCALVREARFIYIQRFGAEFPWVPSLRVARMP